MSRLVSVHFYGRITMASIPYLAYLGTYHEGLGTLQSGGIATSIVFLMFARSC